MSAAIASDSNAEWLSLDFETRSTIDLRKAGVYRYAEDPTTDVICAAFAFDDEPVQTWRPEQPLSNRFVDHVAGGGKVRGWNVNFERLIWREVATPRYGWPAPKLEQLWDTAAQGAALSLPRSLDGCGSALGLTIQKDKEGHALMMRMCRPRSYDEAGSPVWWTDEAKLARLTAYCRRDVEVERAIAKRLRPLSASERVVYLLDARINDRGAALDLDLIAAAQKIVARATTDLDRRMKAVTSGAVPKCTNVAKLVAWLIGRGVDLPTRQLTDKELEAAKEALRIAVLEGSVAAEEAEAELRALAAGKPTLAKAAIRTLLAEDDLEPVAREAIALRAEAALSSTAKLTAMEKAACRDGRLRGAFLYHGTGPGRWCLAEGSRVWVRTVAQTIFEKPIEAVLLSDEVWDGDAWVRHEGVVFSGEKDVIEYDGVVATKEHRVYISDTECITLADAADRKVSLLRSDPFDQNVQRLRRHRPQE